MATTQDIRKQAQLMRSRAENMPRMGREGALSQVQAAAQPTASIQPQFVTYDPSLGVRQRTSLEATGYTPYYEQSGKAVVGALQDLAQKGFDTQFQPKVDYASLIRKDPTLLQGFKGTTTLPSEQGIPSFGPLARQSKQYTDEALKFAQQQYDKRQGQAQTQRLAELKSARDANPIYQQLTKLQSAGVPYQTPQGSKERQMEALTREIMRHGIKDITQVGHTKVGGKDVFYDKLTGQAIDPRIGSTSAGKGFTEYTWAAGPGGRAIPIAKWEESSDRGKIAQALSIGAGLLAPFALGPLAATLGGGLTGAAGAGALYGGATSVLPAAITSGNVSKALVGGALGGAIGGGIGTGAGQLNLGGNIANQAIKGALQGGVRAGLNDQNLKNALLQGAITGGVGGLAQGALQGTLGNLSGIVGGQIGKLAGQQFAPATSPLQRVAQAQKTTQQTPVPTVSGPPDVSQLPLQAQQRIMNVYNRFGRA